MTDREPGQEAECSHGAITAHPSSNPAYPGYATCAICGARMTAAARNAQKLEERVRQLEAARDRQNKSIKANYFADDEFRETVCEMVRTVPDGHWITLIVEDPALLAPESTHAP